MVWGKTFAKSGKEGEGGGRRRNGILTNIVLNLLKLKKNRKILTCDVFVRVQKFNNEIC
jgi:hypothetical protein